MAILNSAVLLMGAVVVALLLSSVLYLSAYEYSHYSTRSSGLDYEYATNWSFSPLETITFFVPSFFGFGGEAYWGKMPFTDYPLYMGIVVLFLAGLALVIRRDRYVIFFAIVVVLSLIVSFGKHLPILYDPMFRLLPFFNRFWIPSMIHILLDISVVIMAGFGLHFLINLKESGDVILIQEKYQVIKKYFYVFGTIGILILFFVILEKRTILEWINNSGKQLNPSAQQIAYQMALKDAVVMSVLSGLSGFFVLFYVKGKLNSNLLSIALIIFLIIDLWLVDFKIIHPKPAIEKQAYFQMTDIVEFLKMKPQPFRIFPINIDQPEEKSRNWYMYFKLQSLYGYHSAKLKIYQEVLEELQLPESYILKFFKQGFDYWGQMTVQLRSQEEIPSNLLFGHKAFLNMLNVKYLISACVIPDPSCQLIKQGSLSIYENKQALPHVFFVDQIKTIKSKEEIFNFIESDQFDPAQTAILEENPEYYIVPNPNNRVEVVSYDIHNIKLKADAKSPTLLVLSEIYYPAGWKAIVDGVETKIFKTNDIFRLVRRVGNNLIGI